MIPANCPNPPMATRSARLKPPRPRKPSPAGTATPALPDAQAAATQVMRVLPQVMDAMRRAMRSQLDGPLTVPQFRALNFIDREAGCSLGAVASFLGVTPATASAMVDRLVRAGHLRAEGDATDRRRTTLRLCPSGLAVLKRMRRQTRDDLAQALAGRSPTELQSLADGLQVLEAAFDHVGQPTPTTP